MAAKLSRYLGVQPFKTSDKHIFFGRDEDIENLHDFIILEKLIVLFGKSGYGKSSLLNAGVVPKLIDEKQPPAFRFRPVEVRLGTFIEAQSFSPTETMKRLLDNVPVTEGSDFLKDLTDGDTLWLHFKQRQAASNGQFVLIFDQFEEFFSYPVAQQEVFRRQLAEVLYADIPQSVRAKLDELTDEQRRYVVKPMNIKAVFAIRSDRMSYLDSMKDTLPAILHKRYELRPLTLSQAKDAITKPARIVSERFSSPPFEYTEGGLNAILNALTKAPSQPPPKGEEFASPSFGGSGGLGIEAFQLQIVCEYIESMVKEDKVPDLDGNGLPDITEAQLPHIETLYSEYYYRKLQELDPSVKAAAQIVLEDGLLAEDNVTGEGRRMSVDSRALIGQFRYLGLTDDLLLALEKTYLIRREVNTVGGFSFEISHDTLVAPIQKAKKDRKYIEEKALEAQKAAEREQQLSEAKRQADIEKRRRQRATALSVVSGIALVLALLAMFWAFKKQNEAEQAVLQFRKEEQERKKLEAQQLIERAKTLNDAGYSIKAKEDLENALKLDTTAQMRLEVEGLRRTIK